MTPRDTARTLLGVIAVLVLSLFGCLNFYQSAEAFHRLYRDPYLVEQQAERFREVKAIVPAEAVIGYLSDAPAESVLGAVMFFGAQYALAPRLLDPHHHQSQERWVLGNFSKPVDLGRFEKENHLRLFQDLGNGVVLFRDETP